VLDVKRDRHQPARIAAQIDPLGLDPSKLWIGIGSGQLRSQIDIVQRAVRRVARPPASRNRIVVAAMRPQLCRLGSAIADGVPLNRILPAQRGAGSPIVAGRNRRGGRATPIVASYVRVAVGSGSLQRLRAEQDDYRRYAHVTGPVHDGASRQMGQLGEAPQARGGAADDSAVPGVRVRPVSREFANRSAGVVVVMVSRGPVGASGSNQRRQ